jgi:hypothetical protein
MLSFDLVSFFASLPCVRRRWRFQPMKEFHSMSINRPGSSNPQNPIQKLQQATQQSPAQKAAPQQQEIRPFEPSKGLLSQQPTLATGKPAQGSFKLGLMPRNVPTQRLNQMMNQVRKTLDSFLRNINWRVNTRPPQNTNPTQGPPLQAMYGVVRPGGPDGGTKPPGGNIPLQPMYGVTIPNPIDNRPPTPIQPMYGVTIPNPIDSRPPVTIQPMYGVTVPNPSEQKPPIMQPMYGVSLPPQGWSLFSKS